MRNYGGLSEVFTRLDTSEIVMLPVSYDYTSTWIKGADKGPEAIFEASENMELYDIETGYEVYKRGIHTSEIIAGITNPDEMVNAVKLKTLEFLNLNKFQVLLGGEHSVSIGAIQAFAEKFQDLSVLQIDAHSDLRDEYQGSKNNHACVMARAKEVSSIVQVGIRSMDASELENVDTNRIFYIHQIRRDQNWKEKVIDLLTDNVYITIDLDGFDPSILPSTGTPEPNGLFYAEVLSLIQKVIQQKKLRGFDVVELCPQPTNKSSDFLAAKLIYQILSLRFLK